MSTDSEAETNPWTTLASQDRFENDWMRVVDHDVLDAKGQRSRYAVVKVKKQGLGIVPIDQDGCIFLVGQYRFAVGQYSWEIPAGGREGEDKLSAARRELEEEVGLVAEQWREILRVATSPNLTDQRATCYLAWQLTAVPPHRDAQEVIRTRRLPFAAALEMIERGEISEAVTIAALLKVRMMAERGELPAELTGPILQEPR